MVDSHKSTGDGPVRSPVCNPSKKTKNTKQTTKTNKQTQQTKQATKNQQQNKKQQTKKKQNNQKNTKNWDRNQQWRFMHDDILCVMMIMAPNKKQNREPRQKQQGPNQGV